MTASPLDGFDPLVAEWFAGRYGEPTSLSKLDARGNLPMAVDFRQVYATALEGWLGVDAEPILGRGFEPQAVFAA